MNPFTKYETVQLKPDHYIEGSKVLSLGTKYVIHNVEDGGMVLIVNDRGEQSRYSNELFQPYKESKPVPTEPLPSKYKATSSAFGWGITQVKCLPEDQQCIAVPYVDFNLHEARQLMANLAAAIATVEEYDVQG